MYLFLLASSLVSVAPPSTAAEALRAADELYERRGEGAVDGVAQAEPIKAAMALYRSALSLDPGSYAARLGLLRAIFFRGGFCAIEEGEQIKLFEEAVHLGDDTTRRLEADLKESRLLAHRDALRREPLAAEIYLWAAVSWGEWAVTHKLGPPGEARWDRSATWRRPSWTSS